VLSFCDYALPKHLTDRFDDSRVGCWESRAIAEFNSGILNETECHWDEAFAFSGGSLPDVPTRYRARAAELIRSEFPHHHALVLKDPQIAFLYDLWSEALASCGYETACVITVRNPFKVAGVLARNVGFPVSRSILPWVSYYLAAEAATRDSRRTFVVVDDLLADWRGCLNRISESLGTPILWQDGNREQLIERFLNHVADSFPADVPPDGIANDAPWIADFFKWLSGANVDRTALAPILAEYHKQRDWFYPLVTDLNRRAADRRSEDLERRALDARSELETARTIIAELQSELHDQRAAAQALELENRLRESQAFAAEKALAAVVSSEAWRITAPLRRVFALVRRSNRVLGKQIVKIPGGQTLLQSLSPAQSVVSSEGSLTQTKEAFHRTMTERFERFIAGDARLRFETVAQPIVSVVLVLWNQAPLTLACLQSVVEVRDIPLEVVVIDNASTDRTTELLDRVDGVRVIRNDRNEGFLKAVNQGVAAARGEHILLLNNDAVLRAGSLVAAYDTLSADDSIGAVGGRIVLLDGRLQEAGSIVWRDGSCLGYARDQAADCGEAMFVRDVDYCSGAFLLFRRATFQSLGGFDEVFAPAYYEEVDFCVRLRQSGLRVVYEPRAVIDHFEFGSSTTSERALALQIRNRATFVEKHKTILQQQHPFSPQTILRARLRDRDRGRILFIDDRVPIKYLGSGYPRARRLVREIVDAGYFVTLYPLRFPAELWEMTYASIPRTVEVAMGRGIEGLNHFIAERRGYYDAIVVSRPHNMELLVQLHEDLPDLLEDVAIIYDAEAVFALRDAQKARLFNDRAALARAEAAINAELALVKLADAVIAVSPADAEYFRKATPAPVHVIGNTISTAPTPRPFAARRDLLFVGAMDLEGSPNVDSVAWFVSEVMPTVRQQLDPTLALRVVGGNRAPSIQALRSRHVQLLGHVESLETQYDQARIFVAPTRFAGGIPLKIHEASAHGLPVVATRVLADQLGWRDQVELLVADDAESFARQVIRLYQDRALWETVRNGALKRVAQDCDPAAFRAGVREVLTIAHTRGQSRLVKME
jgi:GT2 family glycosyltransferase